MMSDETNQRLVDLGAGVWVESDVLDIVKRVQEYDSNLRIQTLGPQAEPGDAPYRLVEHCPDGFDRVVFDIWVLDARVIDRIRLADNARSSVLVRQDKHNAELKEMLKRRYKEEVLGEAKDIAQHILKTPKLSYSLPGPGDGTVTVVDSHLPASVKKVK